MHLDGQNSRLANIAHASKRAGHAAFLFLGFTLYALIAAIFGILLPPPTGLIFLAPFLLLVFVFAPELPPVPRKITWGILLTAIALMPAWPVYLHIKLGPLPIITPTRLMFYALIAIWLYEMACVRRRRLQFYAAVKRLWFLFALIAGLFFLKLLSIPLAEGSAIAAKETFRQSIIWLLPFFAVMTYVRTRKQADRIITILLWAASLVALIALGEFLTRHLIAEIFAPLMSDVEWLRIVLEEKSRDGTFRTQSVHTHPLSLGEQLAMIIPLAMYKIYRPGHYKMRLAYITLLGILLLAALTANSRGALIGGVLAFSATGALMTWFWLKRPQSLPYRPLVGMMAAGIILLSPFILAAGYKLTVGEEGSKAARSSQSRIEQIEYAWPKVLERPVLGYGTGRSARILGYYGETLTIDNYYINLWLELGFPGPIIFLGAILWLGILGFRWGVKHPNDPYAGLYLALVGVAVTFAVTRSILSITTNIELIMIIFATIIGSAGAIKRKTKHTTPMEIERTAETEPYASTSNKTLPLSDHLDGLRNFGAPWHQKPPPSPAKS